MGFYPCTFRPDSRYHQDELTDLASSTRGHLLCQEKGPENTKRRTTSSKYQSPIEPISFPATGIEGLTWNRFRWLSQVKRVEHDSKLVKVLPKQ